MKLNMFMNAIAVLAAKGVFFILTIIAYNGMNEDSFAHYGVLLLLYSTVVGVVGQAMQMTANKYVAQGIGLRSFTVRSAFFVGLGGLITGIAAHFHYSASLISALSIGLALLFGTFLSYNIGCMYGARGAFQPALIYIVQLILVAAAGFTSVYSARPVETLFIYISLISLFLLVVSQCLTPSPPAETQANAWDVSKSVTFPVVFAGLASSSVFLLVVEIIRSGQNFADEMTVFTLANQVRMVVATIPLLFGNVIIKLLARQVDKENSGLQTSYLNYYSAIIPSLLTVLVLDAVCEIWSSKFGDPQAYFLTTMFLYGTAITSFKSGIGRNILSQGLGKISILSNIIWSLMFIIGCYVSYIVNYGVVGIGVAFLTSHLLHYVLFRGTFKKNNVLRISERDSVVSGFFIISIAGATGAGMGWGYIDNAILTCLFLFIVFVKYKEKNVD